MPRFQAVDPAGEGERPAQKTSGVSRTGEGNAQGSRKGKFLSPEPPRRVVSVLQERYRATERFVCRVAGQHRSTQPRGGKVISLEKSKLRHRLLEIASKCCVSHRCSAEQLMEPLLRALAAEG